MGTWIDRHSIVFEDVIIYKIKMSNIKVKLFYTLDRKDEKMKHCTEEVWNHVVAIYSIL